MSETFDITPSPRVLRMLGQIEFKPWQCLAELIDNSIDSFLELGEGDVITNPAITIVLPSKDDLNSGRGKIRVRDNGIGMTPDTLEKSVRAGYSGNDPVEKLGLFGMGFNISTARLGRRTEVWTVTPDAPEWTGIIIDFDEMEKSKEFSAPRLSRPRGFHDEKEHGTEVVITKLDGDRVRELIAGRGKGNTIRKLGKLYTRLMRQIGLEITVDERAVKPRPHCVWDEKRRVQTQFGPVSAIQSIDVQLAHRGYCRTCWKWLTEEEGECPVCGLSGAVVHRPRRIRGWIGIQRFFDTQSYGIDLIRNGRVIEEKDKSLFTWENPSTGDTDLEYPVDTIHWGGRIVGELELDFVRISHQKDAFDRTDPQWQMVVKEIRGDGPLRPKIAEQAGFAPNTSPMGRLFAGYRAGRPAGLQYLVPGDQNGKGINEPCKDWADLFWEGDPEYQTDDIWYNAVKEAEAARRKPAKVVDEDEPSPVGGEKPAVEPDEEPQEPEAKTSVFVDDPSLSNTYELREMTGSPSMKVNARRLTAGALSNGHAVRFTVSGNAATYEYNPEHDFFAMSLDTPLNCLIHELSYQLLSRSQENQDAWPVTRVETELRNQYFPNASTDFDGMAAEATALLEELRAAMIENLASLAPIDPDSVDDRIRDEIRHQLVKTGQAGEQIIDEVVRRGQFPAFVRMDTLPNLVSTWPEAVLDGRFLSVSYSTVATSARPDALAQVIGPLRDVAWLRSQASVSALNKDQWREQLIRASSSLHLLQLWRS